VLYAGDVGAARLVLLQGLDPAGQARVAEVTGLAGGTALRLTRTDPVVPRIPVLAVVDGGPTTGTDQPGTGDPATGSSAAGVPGTASAPAGGPGPPAGAAPVRLRLLGPPAPGTALYTRAGGAGKPALTPLHRLDVDSTGFSEPLDPPGQTYVIVLDPTAPAAPAGVPAGVPTGTASPPAGSAAPGLLGGSGLVNAERLTAQPDTLEYGTPTLAVAGPAAPSYGWFSDGRFITKLLHRPARVASLGPRFSWRAKAGPARGHVFQSQSYEVTTGAERLLSVVVRLDGKVLCADVVQLGRAAAPKVPLSVSRCVAPRYGAGVVQALAAPGTATVTVTMVPAKPGQRRFQRPFRVPAGVPASTGFVVAGLIESGYPTGVGKAEAATAAGTRSGHALLATYKR
jgi:hypothetical protein